MASPNGMSLLYSMVEIQNMKESVCPRDGSSSPVQVNGKLGRVLSIEEDTCMVQTFDDLVVPIPQENLVRYEQPSSEQGGFDMLWPSHAEVFFDFCQELNNTLTAKGWCLLQMLEEEEAARSAKAKAARRQWVSPKAEFATDFLGRDGVGKITDIDPLHLTSISEAQDAEEPAGMGLERYDFDITNLVAVMGPMTWHSMGFHACGRTEAMLWQSFSGMQEAQSLEPQPLSDDDVEEGFVDRHLHFIKRRKLCFLRMIDNNGGRLLLHLRSDIGGEPVELPITKGRMLIFRCDLMSFKFQPNGSHLTLASWVLDDPPRMECVSVTGNNQTIEDMIGLAKGPKVPRGERGHILSVGHLSGGNIFDLAGSLNAYNAGIDGHIYVPQQRFDTDIYFSKNGDEDYVPYKNSYHVHSGLCNDYDITSFDHAFFNIGAEEASLIAPGQRKTLEVGYEALFRAGLTRETLNGAPILLFMGDCGTDWWTKVWERQGESAWLDTSIDFIAAKSYFTVATRMSYVFNMKGPVQQTDTACSSGLTAFCTAMYMMKKPIERGSEAPTLEQRTNGCLAGGINVTNDPAIYVGNCVQHMLSVKGRCFTYDSSAEGYARGEGVSFAYCILSHSDEDTDLQLACPIGNKVNQDGRSASMTAPNGPAQQMCIKASLKEAGVEPHDITASECHGTGTALGDPIEVGSLRGVQETDERDDPIFNTSAKSNLGHLEADAGTTGLFKCIVLSQYGSFTPNVHLRTLNPHLDAAGWPSHFTSEVSDYNQNSGLVGVSSFGVSGTNAHAEVWGQVRVGRLKTEKTRKVDHQLIDQVLVTCPVTLGQIDHITGEPAMIQIGQGRKYIPDVLREDLASYDISSYAYDGGYRFRREELDDDEDYLDPEVDVHVRGSWSGWHKDEAMERQEDGTYMLTIVLGETRCESFYLSLAGKTEFRIYPAMNRASEKIWVLGPDSEGDGKMWMIDGRDEEVPKGTAYQIHFGWTAKRKKVWWEEVDSKFASEAVRYEHRYAVAGSWTANAFQDMTPAHNEPGVWEHSFKIGFRGSETFVFGRDSDWQQVIYPAKPDTTDIGVLVRGPDDLHQGKKWVVNGAVDELVKLRLEVGDGKFTVVVHSPVKSTQVWESREGWERHDYCVYSSWNEWEFQKMEMDSEIPGVFRCQGTVGTNWDERFNGFVEFFRIVVDDDPEHSWYPQVGCVGSGDCMVMGPDTEGGDKPFCVKSHQPGATFEVVFNMNALDRRKIVTWTWDVAPSLPPLAFGGGEAAAIGYDFGNRGIAEGQKALPSSS